MSGVQPLSSWDAVSMIVFLSQFFTESGTHFGIGIKPLLADQQANNLGLVE
jgi:hypothetical protein